MNFFLGIRTSISLCLATLFLISSATLSGRGAVHYPDFDQAMLRHMQGIDEDSESFLKRKKIYHAIDKNFLSLFKEIYRRNIEAAEAESWNGVYRIPRIIHQIWLGSPVPEQYRKWMTSWMELHGWEYHLWTDKEAAQLKMYNQDLYERSKNYGEKSDILRLEILYRYGGVYADTDYECVNPQVLEELHRSFDFYIGFEPLEHGLIKKFNMFKVCNALIAAMPRHPLINDLIQNLKANYYAYRPYCGPVECTGPSYATRIICAYEKSHAHAHRNMYLPCTFLYPYTGAELSQFFMNQRGDIDVFPETMGIHYWDGSWKKKDSNSPSSSGNYGGYMNNSARG